LNAAVHEGLAALHISLRKETCMSHIDSEGETGNEAFILEAVSSMTQTLVTKARRVFSHARFSTALEGVLAVVVGIAVLIWPSASLTAMVLVFAAYAVADGLLSILGALPSMMDSALFTVW